ncbi:hypothetical protein DY000_02004414 [Brassica cretica]|uniref:Uncharacterized protein n=1 Tax=Brassica cretica TaxID=69181 RepID=A0ABQ7C802_BRACR|nr:hypothetical protein DY000_02004414 [Brassica cretica]
MNNLFKREPLGKEILEFPSVDTCKDEVFNNAINMFENCCMGGESGALEPTVPLFPDVEDSCLDRKPFKSCAK